MDDLRMPMWMFCLGILLAPVFGLGIPALFDALRDRKAHQARMNQLHFEKEEEEEEDEKAHTAHR